MNEEDKLLPFKFDVSEWEKKTNVKISEKIAEGRYKLRDLVEFLEEERKKANWWYENNKKQRLKRKMKEEMEKIKCVDYSSPTSSL